MCDHVQIQVQKQGSIDETHWSERTLTIDVPTETATISRREHPDDTYHHSMRVLGIQKWADMKATNSGHGHDSLEAKMTLHLMGVKVPARNYGATPAPEGDAHSSHSHGSHDAQAEHRPHMQHQPGGAGGEVDSSWMVRCTTQEAYAAAVAALEKIAHASQKREDHHHAVKATPPTGPLLPGPVAGESYQRIGASAVL